MHPILAAAWRLAGIFLVMIVGYWVYERFIAYDPDRDDPILRERAAEDEPE